MEKTVLEVMLQQASAEEREGEESGSKARFLNKSYEPVRQRISRTLIEIEIETYISIKYM